MLFRSMAKAYETGRSATKSYQRVEGDDFAAQVAADNAAMAAAAEERAKAARMPPPDKRPANYQDVMDAKARAAAAAAPTTRTTMGEGFKKGGAVKSSASKRGDGIAQRGKTRGRFV